MLYRVTVSEKIYFDYVVDAENETQAKVIALIGATQDEVTSYTDSDGINPESCEVVSEELAKHFTRIVQDAGSTSDNIKVSLDYYNA